MNSGLHFAILLTLFLPVYPQSLPGYPNVYVTNRPGIFLKPTFSVLDNAATIPNSPYVYYNNLQKYKTVNYIPYPNNNTMIYFQSLRPTLQTYTAPTMSPWPFWYQQNMGKK